MAKSAGGDGEEVGKVVPFGKYKGRLVEEVMMSDPNYIEWLSGQDWFRNRYAILYQVIVKSGSESEETPEHNRLQARFLDDGFCLRFWRLCFSELMLRGVGKLRLKQEERRLAAVKDLEDRRKWYEGKKSSYGYGTTLKEVEAAEKRVLELSIDCGEPQFTFKREFEASNSWCRHGDVWIECGVRNALSKESWEEESCGHCTVEIKPTIGDDYPVVLRQMRMNGSGILFTTAYTGSGATLEQFVEIFKASGYLVVFLSAVEA